MRQCELIEMAHTSVGTITDTGIIIARGQRAELSVPLICAIAHGDAFDDMAGARVLTNDASAGTARWQLRDITEVWGY